MTFLKNVLLVLFWSTKCFLNIKGATGLPIVSLVKHCGRAHSQGDMDLQLKYFPSLEDDTQLHILEKPAGLHLRLTELCYIFISDHIYVAFCINLFY